MQRILITGGGGFLGKHLLARLAEALPDALVYAPRRVEYDLTQAGQVEKLFASCAPDVVIHAAADVGGIGYNQQQPASIFYNNVMMGLLLVEASRKAGVEKFIGIGSVCEYPEFCPVPFREDDLWAGYPERTNGAYGVAKRALLVQTQAYRRQYACPAIHLLLANLYGPGDHFTDAGHVIPNLVRKFEQARIANQPQVEVWGTGTPTRDFLYVDDACDAILLALDRYDGPEPMNISTGQECSIRQVAETLKTLIGYDGELVFNPAMPDGQLRRTLDISRAEQRLGFRAKTPLAQGLQATVDWYRRHASSASQ